MMVSPSVCGNIGFRTGVGEDICHPPTENGRRVHCNLSAHGPLSGGGAAPWGKSVQEVVVTREFVPGGVTSIRGGREGSVGGRGGGSIRYR